MKARTKLFLFVLFAGLIMTIACFEDTMLLLGGRTVDLNNSEITDYEEGALAGGSLYYPVGCMMTQETSSSIAFIPTGKVTKYIYLMCSVGHDKYDAYMNGDEELNDFYVVFSTYDKDLISKIDGLSAEWDAYLADEASGAEIPATEIAFEGKLVPQPSEQEYTEARDEILAKWGFKPAEVATYMIEEGKVPEWAKYVFFGGIAAALIGLAGTVISAVSALRKKETVS